MMSFRAFILLVEVLSILRTSDAVRIGVQQQFAFEMEDDADSSNSRGVVRCQYAGLDSQRPLYDGMVSVCSAGPNVDPKVTKACVQYSKSHYTESYFTSGRVITVPSDEISMGMCEELCSTGVFPEVGKCRGYVVRDDYGAEASSKPSCWLIAENARNSSSSPADLKFDKTAMVDDLGHKTDKKTFVKESCGCGTRYVHVARPSFQTDLAVAQAVVKDLTALSEKDGELEPTQDAQMSAAKAEIEQISKKMAAIKPVLKFEGIYDYLPVKVPDRIYRGALRFLPNSVLVTLGKKFAALGDSADALKDQKMFSNYWKSPVKISNVYKSLDFSAIIYQCYEKKTKRQSWYLASKDYLMKKLSQTLETDEEKLTEELTENLGLQISLFFNLKCMGYRLGDAGQVFPPLKKGEDPDQQVRLDVEISTDSLNNGRGVWSAANDDGCFENEEKATKAREDKVIKEILAREPAAGEGDERARAVAPKELLKNDICESLLTGEGKEIISKLEVAETVAQYQKTLGTAWMAAEKVGNAWSAVTGIFKGSKKEEELGPADRMEVNRKQLIERTQDLIEAMKQIVMRIEAIAGTEDLQLKLFCAKEMLELVQNAGGIWPKISQNLAMRPDVVKDDFARNKLKETQSGNKNLGKSKTLQYIEDVRPEIELPGLGKVFILDFMKYERFLSAGSVGQVDIYSLKEGTDAAKVFKETVVPSDWTGRTDKFIVKTVFKETEELYTSDWKLLKLFFTKLGSFLPSSFTIIWATLANMETSIFDEFDLTKEAEFTTRGRAMLKQFTEEYGTGVRATTPLGLATTSKYVMIQSFAQGMPLSSYLEQIKGQKDRLATWRTKIYGTILNVFGYTAVGNGFFQSDPHPGNWFWDGPTNTLSLIDWGGVENWADENADPMLKQGHCNLARLYAGMGDLSQTWKMCDAVVLKSDSFPAIAGTYLRTGVSIYAVRNSEPALLMGHGYALSYTKEDGLNLWFDGMNWQVSEVHPEAKSIYKTLAKITDESIQGVLGPGGDQSFFGKVFGKASESMRPEESKALQLEQLNEEGKSYKKPKMHTVQVSSARSDVCNQVADRTQAYQVGANALGINLKTHCEDFKFINTDTDDLREYLHTDRIALVCIYKNESGDLVGETGVPNFQSPIYKDNVLTMRIEDPVDEGNNRDVDVPMMTGDEAFGLAQRDLPQRVLQEWSTAPETALTINGLGQFIGPQLDEKAEDEPKADALNFNDYDTKLLFLDQTQRMYAVTASLFDSDVTEAAILAIQARQGLSLFRPSKVPEEFTLFARCVLVFHGMLVDVVKENLARLVPIPFMQWLLQSREEDRFFVSWRRYAESFLQKAGDKCPSGPIWRGLGQ